MDTFSIIMDLEIEDQGQAAVRNHKIMYAEGAIKEQNIRGSAEDVLFLDGT